MPDVDLLSVDRGCVIAPAGCGKTHEILKAIERYNGKKPLLVLTHTNAGVAALRSRLARAGIPASRYRLGTIDGWAMRMIRHFPKRSGHDPEILDLRDRAGDYPKIRRAAAALLADGQLGDVLAATYARLIVDEYQDCSAAQHQILSTVAESLPTCILGDPMQAIFDFGHDPLPDWDATVCAAFPVAVELNVPWRWINAGVEELGDWLLAARSSLAQGAGMDLGTRPDSVKWIRLDGRDDDRLRRQAARATLPSGKGSVLVIGDSRRPESQRQMAGQTPGAVAVEAVDLRDFVDFAANFDGSATASLESLLDFASTVMVNADVRGLKARIRSLQAAKARTEPSDSESACLEFLDAPSDEAAANVLVAVAKRPGVRIHRPPVFLATERALRASDASEGSFHRNAVRERERFRMTGRSLPSRAVGSTLLLKGLEADIAVILDADGLNASNLYVGATRGARQLVICSASQVLCGLAR